MERLQAFKFELRPNGEQTRQLWQFAGCSRFVYNKALALQQENHKAELKYISYVQMCKSLTTWRKDQATLWLQLAPAQTLQQSLKDLDRAYQNFFSKRAAFPSYKKKGRGNSFRFPEPKQFKLDQANNRIFLPKLGWMRYRNSRNVIGTLRNITVSERGGKYCVRGSFLSRLHNRLRLLYTHPQQRLVSTWASPFLQHKATVSFICQRTALHNFNDNWHTHSDRWLVGASIPVIGKNRKQKLPACIFESPMSEPTTYIRNHTSFAWAAPHKITRWCVSKT
ncbi:hypothetical protein IMCC3135_31475 [Granulosicoccus antarcticus IMCC3135]|uniref:Transposase putative helix-turn-helix domain-containing protein n=1 Tax=Granulosicoccus antarcticus IMCC3135 TaxID=1192854 RepID=A0A2Z2NYF5_9GAMM|nr:hypothetical protein IMCC3135_31475 [Granulosicoccus antarcticus IMCC3135]